MLERICDLWDTSVQADARCITTNGRVKKNGALVMGRGVAAQAAKRFVFLPTYLGWAVNAFGNRCFCYPHQQGYFLVTFPVKHDWYELADMELIKKSCRELMHMCDFFDWKTVLLPRPGCGNGGLLWEDVKSEIVSLLDDRVIVISKF